MKRYRVLKPHDWQERPNGGTIHGTPGEEAVISDEVFAAAPLGTFELLPGEDGFVPPATLAQATKGMSVEWEGIDDSREWTPTMTTGPGVTFTHSAEPSPPKRIPKAEVFAPAKKRGKRR